MEPKCLIIYSQLINKTDYGITQTWIGIYTCFARHLKRSIPKLIIQIYFKSNTKDRVK